MKIYKHVLFSAILAAFLAPQVFAQTNGGLNDGGNLPHSGIGACPAGQVVSRLNANAKPTCVSVSGAGGVTSVNAGTSISVTGTATAPIVNLNMPANSCPTHQFDISNNAAGVFACAQPAFTDISGTALATQGGTGLASPTAHDLLITEGASNFTLLSMAVDTFLQGNGASVDPSAGSLPNCASDGTHALIYSTSTHNFTCQAISVGTGTVTNVTATAPLTSSGGATPNISATYQGNGLKVQASTGTTTTNDCVKFDANGNTVDGGAACGTVTIQPIVTHTLTCNTTTTAIVSSTTQPIHDVQNLTLSANCATFNLPASGAIADGEVLHIKVLQPSGAHNWTFPSTLTGGAGTTVVFMTSGGCSAMPLMPTGTGHALLLDVLYNANPATPTYDIISCPTDGS